MIILTDFTNILTKSTKLENPDRVATLIVWSQIMAMEVIISSK